jgi:signal transduction histidine kinase
MQTQEPINILLVDDNPANLLTLEAIFDGLGYNLVKAESGRKALGHLLKQDFVVILLDVKMPDMDGFELARLIRGRERTRHIPIIFLTAINKEDSDLLKGYELGAVDYLFKPVVPEILKAKVGFFVDLHVRTRLLIQEQEARRQAEQENRTKDQFLATVSHEIRTPLNAILGWVRLLQTGKLNEPDAGHALETIARNVASQAKLIEDLLDVARILNGKLRLAVGPVDFSSIVHNAVDSAQPAAKAKNIKLQLLLESDIALVYGDPDRLQQVVNNLISNAIKFTPENGTIKVHLGQDDHYIEFKVIDTGKGISPEILPHIFDPFCQADNISRRTEGLGLGLSIVRHLIQLHEGTIKAYSQGEGQGATFTVKLPLRGCYSLEKGMLLHPFLETVSN